MKIRPINDRILVRQLKAPDKRGMLWIPEQAQGEVQLGIVEAVGPGRGFEGPGQAIHEQVAIAIDETLRESKSYREAFRVRHERAPLQVAPGAVVAFGKYSGTKVEVGADELFLLREDELLAEIEGMPTDWMEANKAIFEAERGAEVDPNDVRAATVTNLDGTPREPEQATVADEPPPIHRLVEPE